METNESLDVKQVFTPSEDQLQEAIARLKILKMDASVVRGISAGKIFYSERQSKIFDGILYWIHNEEDYTRIINDFQSKSGDFVYHAQLSHTEFGDLLSLLFVSAEEQEWDNDKEDLKNGQVFVYVVNIDTPDYSEYGTIGVAPKNGGITRTW